MNSKAKIALLGAATLLNTCPIFAASPPPADAKAAYSLRIVVTPENTYDAAAKILDSDKDGYAALDPVLKDPKNKTITVSISKLAGVLDQMFTELNGDSKYQDALGRIRNSCKPKEEPLLEFQADIHLPNVMNGSLVWTQHLQPLPNGYPTPYETAVTVAELNCSNADARCTGQMQALASGDPKYFSRAEKELRGSIVEAFRTRATTCETLAKAEAERQARDSSLSKESGDAADALTNRLRQSGAPAGKDPECQKDPQSVKCYK